MTSYRFLFITHPSLFRCDKAPLQVAVSVGLSVCRSVGLSVTHSFDDPHVAPIGLLGLVKMNKAGYTATPVACEWAGAVIEVTSSFGQEQ